MKRTLIEECLLEGDSDVPVWTIIKPYILSLIFEMSNLQEWVLFILPSEGYRFMIRFERQSDFTEKNKKTERKNMAILLMHF